MGLSRKLGQPSGQPASNNSRGSQIVAYQWSHQSYTIQEILRKFKLPCVVQCATESCSVVWSDFQFDLRQPLLLYSLRTVKKLHARSLNRNTLEEFGPPVAIPQDYEGWFALTPKGVNTLKRHTRIQGVVDANAPAFLVCTKCPAFTSTKGAGSTGDFIPHDVAPGETLKRVCLMEGDLDDPRSHPLVQKFGPCLECLDEKGEDVVVPLSHRAMTYEAAESFPGDEQKVFSTKSIIAAGNDHLPRMFTVIHGNPPSLPYSFTGLYRFYSVFTEETILAATLDDTKSICLELGTDSCAKFNIGLNDVVIKKTLEYNNALHVCHKVGDRFSTGIKVSFSIKPVNALDDIDLSLYDNSSSDALQEVDAKSEFEIAWGSGGKANIVPRDFSTVRTSSHATKASTEGSSVDTTEDKDTIDLDEEPISETIYQEASQKPDDPKTMLEHNYSKSLGDSDQKRSKTLPTSVGEDVVKENPLFQYEGADIIVENKDSVSSEDKVESNEISTNVVLDFDANESPTDLSDDMIEMSLEESDYNTIIIKKANEYDETMSHDSNSDSDSDNCDERGDLAESTNVYEEIHFTTSDMPTSCDKNNTPLSFAPEVTSEKYNSTDCGKRNDQILFSNEETESSAQNFLIPSDLSGESASENVNKTSDSSSYKEEIDDGYEKSPSANGVKPLQSKAYIKSINSVINDNNGHSSNHTNALSPSETRPIAIYENQHCVQDRPDPQDKTVHEIFKQNQTITASSQELLLSSIDYEPCLDTPEIENANTSCKTLPEKEKPSKNVSPRDGEKKGKSDFSLSWFDRLRKFKSGSNVNVCSSSDSSSDSRLTSTKTKPHTLNNAGNANVHKHESKKNHVHAFFPKEKNQDKKNSLSLGKLKGGLLRSDKGINLSTKSLDATKNRRIVAVNSPRKYSSSEKEKSRIRKKEDSSSPHNTPLKNNDRKVINSEEKKGNDVKTDLHEISSDYAADSSRESSIAQLEGGDEDGEIFA